MLTVDELKLLMPLIEMGAKKLRRKLGDLAFVGQHGATLSSALAKLQQMADADADAKDRAEAEAAADAAMDDAA